jgi:hypothetical protein
MTYFLLRLLALYHPEYLAPTTPHFAQHSQRMTSQYKFSRYLDGTVRYLYGAVDSSQVLPSYICRCTRAIPDSRGFAESE